MLMAAASPMGMAFSGTLFLEVPFTAVAMFATWAWLKRRNLASERSRARCEFGVGALLALAFFTKFNYGALLALGIGIDFALEGAQSVRTRASRVWLRAALRMALVPAVLCLWWFVLPLPGGLEVGAGHRQAFLGFLSGNQTQAPTPFAQRLVDWCVGVFVSPRAAVLTLGLVLLSLACWRVREVRSIWIVGCACVVPVALHPFHLDRLLLPGAPFIWVLMAAGGSAPWLLAKRWRTLILTALLVGVVPLALPVLNNTERLLNWAYPGLDTNPEAVAYREETMERKRSLAFARALPTAGLPRAESDAVLDAIAREVSPDASLGWLGAPEKLAPGALHVGLLARGGSRARFLANARDTMMFGVAGEDPHWDAAQLSSWAGQFDVILCSDPPDLGGKRLWSFLQSYRERLSAEHAYAAKEYAQVQFQRPMRAPETVRLIVLRATK
jgi:hypothetical protein